MLSPQLIKKKEEKKINAVKLDLLEGLDEELHAKLFKTI